MITCVLPQTELHAVMAQPVLVHSLTSSPRRHGLMYLPLIKQYV
jgi:hypothetical protein